METTKQGVAGEILSQSNVSTILKTIVAGMCVENIEMQQRARSKGWHKSRSFAISKSSRLISMICLLPWYIHQHATALADCRALLSLICLTFARGCRRTFLGQKLCRVGGAYYCYNFLCALSFDPHAGTRNALTKHNKPFPALD